jgi:membrane protease YdiL (CAAX protease family)
MSLRCVERSMFSRIKQSPTLIRVLPFAIFLVLTFSQERFGEAGRYWIYFIKSVAGGALIVAIRPYVHEIRLRFSWAALLAGTAVAVVWVGLDSFYPRLHRLYPEHVCPVIERLGLVPNCVNVSARADWNPNDVFGTGSFLSIFFIVVRIVGSSIVVPPLEEMFYRSFVYRYLAQKDFLALPLNRFLPIPFLTTSMVFGFVHDEWLAGILCGFMYQGLVLWKGRLGDAILAHAITNCLLGVWVVWRGAWHFW